MPREIHHTRRYRFTRALPLTVEFPSVVYRLEFRKLDGTLSWHIAADSLAGDAHWHLLRGPGDGPEICLYAAYLEGFELLYPTVPAVIMERLCREGRAEPVPATASDLWWAFWGPPLAH